MSPLVADDTAATIKAAAQLHTRAQCPNLFIKIPGTAAGIPAMEETIFIFLGFASINIYTEVGLVTLMGLISKHGILIVQVANSLRKTGKSKREAIEEAAGIRLRPILMTTAAMVFGVLPLVLASGAGAAGRYAMGLVIFTGMSIGTMFTLFVVPAMYMFLASEHQTDLAPVEPSATPALPG